MNTLKYTLAGILAFLLVFGVIFQLTGKLPQINLDASRSQAPEGFSAFFRGLELRNLTVTSGKDNWPDPESSVLLVLTAESWKNQEQDLRRFAGGGGVVLALNPDPGFLEAEGWSLEDRAGGIVDVQGRELGFRALRTFQEKSGSEKKSKGQGWEKTAPLKIGEGAWSLKREMGSGEFWVFSEQTPFTNRGLRYAALEYLLAPVFSGRKTVHIATAVDAVTWTKGEMNPLSVLFGPALWLPTSFFLGAVAVFFWASAPRFGSPRGWKPHSRRQPDAHPRAVAALYHKARAWELVDMADRQWVQLQLKLKTNEKGLFGGVSERNRHHVLARRRERHELWLHYQQNKKGRV